jgi:hypothetical protein
MSNIPSSYSVTLTYCITYKAAELSLEHAFKSEKYRALYLINVYVMSAFSLEAYLNDFCAVSLPSHLWKSLEKKLNPIEKINLLSSMLGFKIDFSRQPFQEVRNIFRLRDKFAHAKRNAREAIPEYIARNEFVFPEDDISAYLKDLDKAVKIHKTVYEVINFLHNLRKNKDYDRNPLDVGTRAVNISIGLRPKKH